MDDREPARLEVAGHSSVLGRGAFVYGHIRSGRFCAGTMIQAGHELCALTIAHIEFMDKVSTQEAYTALFFQEQPSLEFLQRVFPVGCLVKYDPPGEEREQRVNLNVAVRLAKARLQLQTEPDPGIRALLQDMADEDAMTLGPSTLTIEAHRAEAQRFLAQVEPPSRHDYDAAKVAARQAAAHALWAEDMELVREACHQYDRLRVHDDDYPNI